MQDLTVLLLDTGSNQEVTSDLKRVLASLANFRLGVQEKCIDLSDPEALEKRLSYLILEFEPALILFVIPKQLLKQARQWSPYLDRVLTRLPILIVTDSEESSEILELLKRGFVDFLIRPFKKTDVSVRIGRILEKARCRADLMQSLKEKLGLKQIIGESEAFQAEINKMAQFAKLDVGVLITGETGTGKELFARTIHYLSSRADKPFIPVNCAAIPVDLIENELFGHQRGAYTGAHMAQPGLIGEAEGGTLFLDEVDSLLLMAQAKLLRLLQEKEYRPLGASRLLKVDVRIIAASNTNLEEAVAAGRFRQDLYYRLNVVRLDLLPLRERRGDIALLARHFLAKYASEFNKPITAIAPEALRWLQLYHWPGNVRELEHVIQQAVVLCEEDTIRANHISLSANSDKPLLGSFQEMKAAVVSEFEKVYIQEILAAYKGNISKAARAAKKERRTFWELIRKHKIDVERFKAHA